MTHPQEFRAYFDAYCTRMGFKKIKKGRYWIKYDSDPKVGIDRHIIGRGGGITSIDARLCVEFTSLVGIMKAMQGTWDARFMFGQWWWNMGNIRQFDIELDYLSQIDERLDWLLDQFVECAMILRERCSTVEKFREAMNYQLPREAPFNPMFDLPAFACDIHLGRYELVREAVHWCRTDNVGKPLRPEEVVMMDNIERLLAERAH